MVRNMVRSSDHPVILEKINHTAVITIHRPEKLNALSLRVIEEITLALDECERDDEIGLVIFEGAGERAFCAGGDVKSVYELGKSGDYEGALNVFRREFDMDFKIAAYSKPILSYLDGITMGGGVGMSVSAPFRVVTERTKWAMPEMKIGLFPDVGTSYYLSKLPNGLGHFICLTSRTFDADDCLYIGAADYKIDSADYPKMKERLIRTKWTDLTRKEAIVEVSAIISPFSKARSSGCLEEDGDLIRRYFERDSLKEILSALESAAEQGAGRERKFSSDIFEELKTHPMASMAVVMEQHRRARAGLTVKECLEQDYVLVGNFLKSHDFYEGVRAVLVEKTGKPRWSPKFGEEVDVSSYFES